MTAYVSGDLRAWVRLQDQGCCAYCRSPEELSIAVFEIDHIIPVSQGGKTEPQNLCLCCPRCNRYKSAQQRATDPESGERVPLFHPRKQDWQTHFRWSRDRLRLIGLTPSGRATIQTLEMNRQQLVHLRSVWSKLGYAPWAIAERSGEDQ